MADDGILDLSGPTARIQKLITKHGGYNFVRTLEMSQASGRKLCSSGNYPCTHRGIDLAADEGTEVIAPEPGFVLFAVDGDDVRPFSRYGPAVVVIKGASGYFHLIAHLAEPNPFGDYRKATAIPTAQPLSTPLAPEYYVPLSEDEPGPIEIADMAPTFEISAGGSVGFVSTARHVHWEVRRKATDKLTTIDPIDWLAAKDRGVGVGGGSGSGLLLIAAGAAYAYSRRKRHG